MHKIELIFYSKWTLLKQAPVFLHCLKTSYSNLQTDMNTEYAVNVLRNYGGISE